VETMTATIQQIESHMVGGPAGFAALLRRDREEAGLCIFTVQPTINTILIT
jgi:hypothetical protein